MWCWIGVVKEGLLAQDGPGARHKDGETLWAEEQRRGVAQGQLVLELLLAPLPYPLLTSPFPHRKASQKGPGYSKAETRPYPENPQKWQTASVIPFVSYPSPLHPHCLLRCQFSGHSWILPAPDKVLRRIVLLSWN